MIVKILSDKRGIKKYLWSSSMDILGSIIIDDFSIDFPTNLFKQTEMLLRTKLHGQAELFR